MQGLWKVNMIIGKNFVYKDSHVYHLERKELLEVIFDDLTLFPDSSIVDISKRTGYYRSNLLEGVKQMINEFVW